LEKQTEEVFKNDRELSDGLMGKTEREEKRDRRFKAEGREM